MTLADECAARVHDRARQVAARIINREEAMTAQDAAQGADAKLCPHCGQTFTHGERYACCSGCGLAFVGQAAFDAHQRVMDNSLVCLPPEGMARKDGKPMFEPLQRSGKAGSGTFWRLTPRADAPGNPWRPTDV